MASEPSGDTGQLDAADLLRRVRACGVDVRLGRDRVRAVYDECRVYQGEAGLHMWTLTNDEALPIITVAALEAVIARCVHSPEPWTGIAFEVLAMDKPLPLAAVEALEAVTNGGERAE